MKKPCRAYTLLTVSFLALFLTLSALGQTDFNYERYKTRTLSEIVALNSNGENADITISKQPGEQVNPILVAYTNLLHSEVRVVFMKKSRPISAEHREVFEVWKKSLGIKEKVAGLYESEYLFKECEKEYWIPVQKQVAEFFPKELKHGDMVSLFLFRAGGKKLKDDNNWDWLFLLTEFEK